MKKFFAALATSFAFLVIAGATEARSQQKPLTVPVVETVPMVQPLQLAQGETSLWERLRRSWHRTSGWSLRIWRVLTQGARPARFVLLVIRGVCDACNTLDGWISPENALTRSFATLQACEQTRDRLLDQDAQPRGTTILCTQLLEPE